MAVSVTYGVGVLESIDPTSITGNADATSLSGGGVAVVGDHLGHTDASIFDPNGDLTGTAAVITGTESAVSQLSDGNIVIASDNGSQAFYTIINGSGTVIVPPTASDVVFSQLLDVDVTGLTGGGFVVASQAFFSGTDNDIRINVRSNDGTSVVSFSVDSSGANDQNPSVAGLADGGFVVAWHRNIGSDNEMWYAVYEANGAVRKAPALLDTAGTVNRNASVVALDSGGFAIAYEDNGWSGTDIDITLAQFDAAGTFLQWDDISQNTVNDTLPSLTVLSNGMFVVGSVNDLFSDTDPTWTLVDAATGAKLAASSSGTSLNNDTSTTVAGMLNGQVAAFHTNLGTGDVVGQILQARRTTVGDAAADLIIGDELVDIVKGGDGSDTIRGGANADNLDGENGNDTFEFNAGEIGADTIIGGADFDRILALGNTNVSAATVSSIEEVEFNFPNATATVITIGAGQVGAGLAGNLHVDGNLNAVADTLRVTMGAATSVNISGFTFQDFDTGGSESDRVQIVGDADAETIVGSIQADLVTSFGGNDTLNGGVGNDTLRGGLGNDTYVVNAAGEAIEAAGQGVDTVRAGLSFTLGANLENLVLTGAGNLNGTGNSLNNVLTGNSGFNTLNGGIGNDVLGGGLGEDTMTGGAGRDRFDFNVTAESAPPLADVITDFVGRGNLAGDVIDLSTIDANVLVGGNQAFTFIGSGAFTAAGQVRYAAGFLVVNTDADAQAELRIELAGSPPLVLNDLIL